jgi:hypothetical protein
MSAISIVANPRSTTHFSENTIFEPCDQELMLGIFEIYIRVVLINSLIYK